MQLNLGLTKKIELFKAQPHVISQPSLFTRPWCSRFLFTFSDSTSLIDCYCSTSYSLIRSDFDLKRKSYLLCERFRHMAEHETRPSRVWRKRRLQTRNKFLPRLYLSLWFLDWIVSPLVCFLLTFLPNFEGQFSLECGLGLVEWLPLAQTLLGHNFWHNSTKLEVVAATYRVTFASTTGKSWNSKTKPRRTKKFCFRIHASISSFHFCAPSMYVSLSSPVRRILLHHSRIQFRHYSVNPAWLSSTPALVFSFTLKQKRHQAEVFNSRDMWK